MTLPLAVIGAGRIGSHHARHAAEFAVREGTVQLDAVVDPSDETSRLVEELSSLQGRTVRHHRTIEDLLETQVPACAVISSPTALHQQHTIDLVQAGTRVLLEKPLTSGLKTDRSLVGFLNQEHPNALMLAFQRRFDAPLLHAKSMLDQGTIGRPFKFVSVLEDSKLMREGYDSPGLLQDMSIHNVDELLWLSGQLPESAVAFGSRLYSHRLTTVEEDFDDASIRLAFPGEAIGVIDVSRNHVSGYRVETWIYGEEGTIHVGAFHQDTRRVCVEAYGRETAIEVREFPLREYEKGSPEFIHRFGGAYAAELETFIQCCAMDDPFPVDQNDGLRAMEVVDQCVHSLASAPA